MNRRKSNACRLAARILHAATAADATRLLELLSQRCAPARLGAELSAVGLHVNPREVAVHYEQHETCRCWAQAIASPARGLTEAQ